MPDPTDDGFERSQVLVHSDPKLKRLATGLHACGSRHYAGADALVWAAWDAYHALEWASRPGGRSPAEAALAAWKDTGLATDIAGDLPCVEEHVRAVLEAVDAG
jgi:hypothetical protein